MHFYALRLAALLCVLNMVGCKTLMFWRSGSETEQAPEEKSEEVSAVPEKPRPIARPDPRQQWETLELAQTQLWARLDELENQVARQRERLALLERGLITGLIPDELKNLRAQEAQKTLEQQNPPATTPPHLTSGHVAAEAPIHTEQAAPVLNAKPSSSYNKKEYENTLAKGIEQYRSGNFGAAIAEFSLLAKKYGEEAEEGLHYYWIGRSWVGLREFDRGKEALEKFLQIGAKSPQYGRGQIELARVLKRMNLPERARQILEQVMKSFPDGELAEIARADLDSIKRNL